MYGMGGGLGFWLAEIEFLVRSHLNATNVKL